MSVELFNKMVDLIVAHNGNGGKEELYRRVNDGELTEEAAALILLRAHLRLLVDKVDLLSELTA